jgi:hypothetical protein
VANYLVDRKRASHETIRKRMSFEMLHDEEANRFAACGVGINGLADVVERADVGVIERGYRAGLAFEAGPPIAVDLKPFGEDFDGDSAIEPCVPCFVHLAHAAGTNQPDDLVGSEANTGRERHWTVW